MSPEYFEQITLPFYNKDYYLYLLFINSSSMILVASELSNLVYPF